MISKISAGKIKILTILFSLCIAITTEQATQKANCETLSEYFTQNRIQDNSTPPKEPLDFNNSVPNIANETSIKTLEFQSDETQKETQIETDQRRFIRFNNNTIKTPVIMALKDKKTSRLLDISRGGAAFYHNNELQAGEIIPISLNYKNIEINTNIKVIYSTEHKAGGEFTNLDKPTQNQLLYLSIMLEADNNMLKTKFSS